jgi:hypothetical protein
MGNLYRNKPLRPMMGTRFLILKEKQNAPADSSKVAGFFFCDAWVAASNSMELSAMPQGDRASQHGLLPLPIRVQTMGILLQAHRAMHW